MMATATRMEMPARHHVELSLFRPEDLDTASIRSAAPSYISEVPSYHTTVSANNEAIPEYTPPPPRTTATNDTSTTSSRPSLQQRHGYTTSTLFSHTHSSSARSIGLPPVPGLPRVSSAADEPSLAAFTMPRWSMTRTNPTYERVAHRRAQAAANEGGVRRVLDGVTEEAARLQSQEPLRPLEDPYLVGEVAARTEREARLARENGIEVLIQEDRRWDWFLAQMNDWDERDQSWKNFRRQIETGPKGRLARRMGMGSGIRF